MTDPEFDDHENRVRYLYEVALFLRDEWRAESTVLNWRRWRYAKDRYERVRAEKVRRFGLVERRSDGTEMG